MKVQPLANPGIGDMAAPKGSRPWAEYIRLKMQGAVKNAEWETEHFASYVAFVIEHRAWSVMNKPDHTFFQSFEEFCEHHAPWGLGRPMSAVRAIVELARGTRATELLASDQATFGRAGLPATRRLGVPQEGNAPHAEEERLRAILRAPMEVHRLHRDGLIGSREAARLDPRPRGGETADEALDRVRAITYEVTALVEQARPTTDAEKRAVARQVNALVRRRLGAQRPASIDALSQSVEKLTASELGLLHDRVTALLREREASTVPA